MQIRKFVPWAVALIRWHGFVMLIPIVNVVAIVIFAFSAWPLETKVLELELRDANK